MASPINGIICCGLVVIQGCFCFMSTQQTALLISDFLFHKQTKLAICFACFNKSDVVAISRTAYEKNYARIAFGNITTVLGQEIDQLDKKDKMAFVLDVGCPGYQHVLDKFYNQYYVFDCRFKWLVIDSSYSIQDETDIKSTFENARLRYDSDFTVLAASASKSDAVNVSLYDVYNPGFKRGELQVVQIGYWTMDNTATTNYVVTDTTYVYDRRKDLTNTTIRAGTVHQSNTTLSPEKYYTDVGHRDVDTINKFNYALFMHIKEIHNFTLVLTLADRWFGDFVNGTDGGLSKLLVDDEVDVGATAGIIKVARLRVIDFIVPTFPFRTCFIFKNPGTSGVRNEFLQPFSLSTWYASAVFGLVFCIVLKISNSISRDDYKDNLDKNWSFAALTTLAAYCQQGTLLPSPTSGRLILLFLLVMTLLLHNYYTSIIVSTLLMGGPPSFTTIAELTSSSLEIGMEDAPYVRTLFATTAIHDIKLLYTRKMLSSSSKKPNYLPPEQGIARVKEGGFAYHTEAATGYGLIETSFDMGEVCDLEEINLFTPGTLIVMTQKRCQYKQSFAVGYRKMIQSGIHARQLGVWVAKKPECLSSSNLVQVGIAHVSPAFIVLFAGIVGGVVILVLEIFVHKVLTEHAKNSNKCIRVF